jgi:hypothetical protein
MIDEEKKENGKVYSDAAAYLGRAYGEFIG